ncbi:MAG: nicotinate-nucleotide--dimethylbenzimidazole phosphoribosyltransferase [Oscillospiraceae bacterium]|nr:nicotinate-nucleotide--dimethylbenzimidazole phosphoribosyltransferase [Oscillospiraceae bacterium]
METLEELINSIGEPDEAARRAAQTRWDAIAKPLGSLGLLESAVADIAALRGDADVHFAKRTLVVFCADNGVVRQGVTQCGSEVTARVAAALAEGRSTVSLMARAAGCEVLPADMGMLDFPGHPGVLDLRVQNGTGDISQGPAMTREACLRAVLAGAALAKRLAREGTDVLLLGEMGIGNTTTAAAVTAALLSLSLEAVCGRGAGLSDAGLARKRQAVARALACNTPDPADAIDVLAKVGGLDIAALCGAFLGAASARVPAVIDGVISAAAALCACRLCPRARAAMLASHVSSEPAAAVLLETLKLRAPISAQMHLGEGSGAVALLPLLDLALSVYRSGQSFDKLGIAAYVPQN